MMPYEIASRGFAESNVKLSALTAALLREKERVAVTLASLAEAVITFDRHGRIDYLNPAAEALIGWDKTQAQGRCLPELADIVRETTRDKMADPVNQCLSEGTPVHLADDAVLSTRNGCEFFIDLSGAPLRDLESRIVGAVVAIRDVSEMRKVARQLDYQATHDALTGLVNRREFERRLERILATTSEGLQHALLYLDLDQFKVVNDTGGHAAGDELLRELALVLQSCVRQRDTLARLGGDEFGVLLEGCAQDQARRIALALRQAVEDFRFVWQDKSFGIAVSIGLVPITDTLNTPLTILSAADRACYAAKEKGRNRVHVYRPDDAELARRHGEMQWLTRLKHALSEQRLRLWAQPIVSLKPERTSTLRAEILLRMLDEQGNVLPPGAFLPAAERYQQMRAIDRYVIGTVFGALCNLSRDNGWTYNINLSGQSLGDEAFLPFVIEQFDQFGVPCSRICFEITETAAIANLRDALHFINALRERDCRFALDDFGSGLSSFGYLKTLPVDYLKIDGSFVRDMIHHPLDHAIVESVQRIAEVSGIKTVAEWVETDACLATLKAIGVDYAQGYGIARPAPFGPIS